MVVTWVCAMIFIIDVIANKVQTSTTSSARKKFTLSVDSSGNFSFYTGGDDEDDDDSSNEALPASRFKALPALMTHHCTFTTETAPPCPDWVDVVVERFTPDDGTEPHDVKYVENAWVL